MIASQAVFVSNSYEVVDDFLFAWEFFLKLLKVHTLRGLKVSNRLTVELKIYPSRDNYQKIKFK